MTSRSCANEMDAFNSHVSKTIEVIYAAATAPERWPEALDWVARCFDDYGALLFYRRRDQSFGIITSQSAGMIEGQKLYHEEWWRQDIRGARCADYGWAANAGAVTDRHVMTEEETRTHPFYTQFLARFGLKWTANVQLACDHHEIGLSTHRVAAKDPYSDAELDKLALLARHAEQAIRLTLRLIDLEVMNRALGDALARLGSGVFVLDAAGTVVFANAAAEKLLGQGFEKSRGCLRPQAAKDRAAFATAVGEAIRGPRFETNPKPLLVRRASTDRPLVAYVLPARDISRGFAGDLFAEARALVLVIDSAPHEAPDPSVVRNLFGVTLGEARVTALVGTGVSPRDAGHRLGISEETVRTVLKRVFAKVGVCRQSELTALLTKLALPAAGKPARSLERSG